MKLSEIIEGAPDLEIESLTTDSRKATKGCMFLCLDGFNTNGHAYIKQAIEKGAICVVHSEPLDEYPKDVAFLRVDDVMGFLNKVVAKMYDYPSKKMKVFGITGTNGKSTVANIIKDIYDHFEPCGYVGTIDIRYQDVKLEPNLTTPDAIYLHELLSDMVQKDVKAVALEVSSHGLEQKRVDAIDFDVAVFTNFTHDHLDYHGTMDNYFNAKKKLFANMKKDGVSILNVDDEKYNELKDTCVTRVVTYGIEHEADYRADNIVLNTKCSTFTLLYSNKEYEVQTNLLAMYNIYNLLAAIASVVESGISIEKVLPFINNINQIEGRMENIDEGQPFTLIVDFAHTPDGLEKIYEYANTITSEDNDIISVFGSAGKRDKEKRKTFGEISDKYCDYIILTEDDPRDESAKEIAEEIKSGIQNTQSIFIEDRYDAIRMAIESANVNDTILILGKGDEEFIYRGFNDRAPWMGDDKAAREILHKYYLGDISSQNDE